MNSPPQPTLVAHHVFIDRSDSDLMIAFTDDPAEAGRYVLLARSLLPPAQGAGPERDGVYLECNDQYFGSDGGVEQCVLHTDRLALDLRPETADCLGCKQIVIKLMTSDDPLPRLREALREMFPDPVVFKDQSA